MRFGDKPIPENIMELIPKAQRILDENPRVIFAYLFGGLAKGRTLQILIEICIDVDNNIISYEKWKVPFFKNMNLSANLKAIFKLRILSPYIILLSDSLNLNYLLVRPKVKSLVLEQELWQ
jgi:predicted nucleotidyltransferase